MSGALDFPPNPTVGQIHTQNGQSWVWNGRAWSANGGDAGAEFVRRDGDTMTGALTISREWPGVVLDKPAGGTGCTINASTAEKPRWAMRLGDATAESGGNAGSGFVLERYADDGSFLGTPLWINRANSDTVLTGVLFPHGGISGINGAPGFGLWTQGRDGRVLSFEPNTFIWKHPDGPDLQIGVGNGGALDLVTANRFVHISNGGWGVFVNSSRASAGNIFTDFLRGNPDWNECGYQLAHVPGQWAGHQFYSGASSWFTLRNNGVGYSTNGWQALSDARLKTDVQPITDALARLAKITGCTFLRADDKPLYTDEQLAALNAARDGGAPISNPPQRRRAGFIAQDVEAAIPEAVEEQADPPEGYSRDEGGGLRSLDPTGVLALAVEAIKALQARVEELERRLA